MSQSLPNSIFEIFLAHCSDQSFIYGQGPDEPQTSTLYQNYQLGYSDMVPDSSSNPHIFAERVFQRNDSLVSVFNARDLLATLA